MSNLDILKSKILPLAEIRHTVARLRFKGKKIVFTNGCFDILHLGHVDYLAKAADEGDVLFVGINTDESTTRLKGPSRPINDEIQRSILIASLHFVDHVVLFGEDTPLDLIKSIEPDVLVKGADYQIEKIVGADFVISLGGTVKTIEFLPGYSTTAIVNKIKMGQS
ncbi:MAG: D-glycero-beta-D-manno-heptose 1-phosphate adenylyltransferase [Bacteroidota bacterium]